MKEKISGILILIAIVLLIILGYYYLIDHSSIYYTRIDNNKIIENDSKGGVINFKGDLKYLYNLDAYNSSGHKKEITFGTNKELQDKIFIKLEIKAIRGVISWEEITYNELPDQVKKYYKN